jgi:hypothetical protein
VSFEEYAEMFRHYFPKILRAEIRECWKHHATPAEYRAYIDALNKKTGSNLKKE